MIKVVLANVGELLFCAFPVEVVERNDCALADSNPLEDDLAETGLA